MTESVVARYRPTLAIFRCALDEHEERLRCGCLYLRDHATAAMREATPDAAHVLAVIERLALSYVYAPMSREELETLHDSMMRLMLVARALELRGPGRREHDG